MRFPAFAFVSSSLVLSVLVACSSDDDGGGSGAGGSGGGADAGSGATGGGGSGGGAEAGASEGYVVATYNAGFALTFVDYAAERAPVTTAALAAESFDLLCVQEFWETEHWDALVSAATDLPHALRQEDMPGGGGTCTPTELDPLEACLSSSCAPGADLTSCALDFCGAELGGVAATCLDCLIANVGLNDVAVVRAACEGDGGPVSDAGSSEGAFTYGGSFGTGLLSNRPFSDSDEIVMDSFLNRRGVIYGRIDDTPVGTVHAFCTHLTAAIGGVPYNGPSTSFEAEQRAQVTELLAFVDGKASAGDVVVVLGDFNNGPDAEAATANFPDNYAALLDGGLTSVYADQSDATCTFCADNPLVGGGSGSLIDHVLLRGFDGAASAERFLTEDVDVEVDGATVTTKYSDHYGVRATLTR